MKEVLQISLDSTLIRSTCDLISNSIEVKFVLKQNILIIYFEYFYCNFEFVAVEVILEK